MSLNNYDATILLEIRGGILDDIGGNDDAEQVAVIKIDWDDLGADEAYARQIAEEVRNSALREDDKQRILVAIEDVWPGASKPEEETVVWTIFVGYEGKDERSITITVDKAEGAVVPCVIKNDAGDHVFGIDFKPDSVDVGHWPHFGNGDDEWEQAASFDPSGDLL